MEDLVDFFNFSKHPGHLYVLATLLPLPSFFLLLLWNGVRSWLRRRPSYDPESNSPATRLYASRRVRVKCLADGKWREPAQELDAVLPPEVREYVELPQLQDDGLGRMWLANRGVWGALPGAGPTLPIPATEADVDHYVHAYTGLLEHLAGAGS